LVIGQGAREHALAWKLAQSPAVSALYVAPGNGGTRAIATNIAIPATATEQLAGWAVEQRIDLAVVGPEAALAAGVVDAFRARGLRIFGPTRAAARLETSKAFAKAFMVRHGLPTAGYAHCASAGAAEAYLAAQPDHRFPLVLKADGLAAGKGVRIVRDRAEARSALADYAASLTEGGIVVEEFLDGFEVSFLVVTDGASVRALASAHDYKRAQDGDRGPMTGGMGAYSPVANERAWSTMALRTIVEPAIAGMAAEGTPYTGILYAGLMLTADGPRVLEFNARFGDPETQVLLPRWEDDLLEVLLAATAGRLAGLPPFRWSSDATCGVVLASAGYPDRPVSGGAISGLAAVDPAAVVFHGATHPAGDAGTACEAGSGRVLTVVGRGGTVHDARCRAYEVSRSISFPGCWCRADIGATAVDARPDTRADATDEH
jgi:phosphoribosylamine--glycine ligase